MKIPRNFSDFSFRCNTDIETYPGKENSTECIDLNAGSLHVLLANQLGNMNEGFIIDRDRSIQVWNQPMYSFESKIIQQSSSRNGNNVVLVNTDISYGKETSPMWSAHETKIITETYEYSIELDNNGNIVGGTHQTWDRPDFGWKMQISDFYGYFSSLKTIYEASVNQSTPISGFTSQILKTTIRLGNNYHEFEFC